MASMSGGIPRYRSWRGPAVLGAGFRPFFLLAGLWAAIAILVWLAAFAGLIVVPTAFAPTAWHAHEMLFGFVQAAVAGFLLTAVPNWTGRMPIQGWGLAGLAAVFVAGRIAVACSAMIGPAAALIDLAFPVVLLAVLGREIVAGRNWRNMPMLAVIVVFASANGLTHAEALGWAETGAIGLRLGIAVIAVLITLVGGRVIPSFTRNWLAKRDSTRLPAPVGRFDAATIAVTVAALLVWTAMPDSTAMAGAMALAAAMNFLRLSRWRGYATMAEPLVWILHIGYLWLPVAFILLALAPFVSAVLPSAPLHALTGGAMATMVLAVSTRATLGHTGRALHAGPWTVLMYGFVIASAAARVGAGFAPAWYDPLLAFAGLAWTATFGIYVAVYGPMLLRPNSEPKPA